MPTYGYQCTKCKHEFQAFQSMKDNPLTECPQCGSPVKRLLYPVGVVFKGTGWYINDSRAPEKSSESSSDKPGNGDENDKKSDSKGDTKDAPSAGNSKPVASASNDSKS